MHIAARIAEDLGPLFARDQPGAAVLASKHGETVFRKGYGLADIARGVPVDTDMVFRIGSVTKQFTAVAVLMLAEEQLLDVQEDITRYIAYPTHGRAITVEHLLTHTSGIADYTGKADFDTQMGRDKSVAEMIAYFRDEAPGFDPGERFDYSNSNYFLLGAIIEAVSGQPYGRFMEQRIFLPLGMRHTAYEGMERSTARRAAGYKRTEAGFEQCNVISMSQPYAAGAMVSTVDDLARWDRALSRGMLLKPDSLQLAFKPFTLNDGSSTGYGYGWDARSICPADAQWHDGGIEGYASFVLRIPEQGVFVAVLSNCEEGIVAPEDIAKRVTGLMLSEA